PCLVAQPQVHAVIVQVGADVGFHAGRLNDVGGHFPGGVEQYPLRHRPVGVVGDADDHLVQHVGGLLGDRVIDDDLAEEHRVRQQDVTAHGFFATDRPADLIEHRVHGTDLFDVTGQAQAGQLHAVVRAEGALEGNEEPGRKTAHRGL